MNILVLFKTFQFFPLQPHFQIIRTISYLYLWAHVDKNCMQADRNGTRNDRMAYHWIFKKINTMCATCGAGTDYTVRAPLQYHIEKPGSGWLSELGRWI